MPFRVPSPPDGQVIVCIGSLVVVIPGISIACFAAFSAPSFPLILMCAAVFPGYGTLLIYHISDLVGIGWFSLMFSMASVNQLS